MTKQSTHTSKSHQSEGDAYADLRHTLKAPLTRIHLYAEGLLTGMAGPVAPEQKEYLEEIHRSAKMMVDLVNTHLHGPKSK